MSAHTTTTPGAEWVARSDDLRGSAANYGPGAAPTATLGPLLRARSYDEAVREADALMPGALLSPSVHLVLAEAHGRLGDNAAADRQLRLARAGIDVILDSGDGSEERPWVVSRISDEYDVLHFLDTRSVLQQVLDQGERRIDRHECADGSLRHFDVTGLP